MFLSVAEDNKAEEYLHKALAIRKETGNKKVKAATYRNLGAVFGLVGKYQKAKENQEKALVISKKNW